MKTPDVAPDAGRPDPAGGADEPVLGGGADEPVLAGGADELVPVGGADEEVASSIRGSSLLLVGRLVAMGLALVTQALIVRVVDKADYGVFAFGLTLVSAFRVLVSFGDSQSVGRFLTLEAERRDRDGFKAMLFVVLTRIVIVSAVVMAGVVIGAGALTDAFLSSSSDRVVIILLVALAPLEALGAALGAVFAVFGQVRMVLLRKYLYAPTVRLLAVAVLAIGGFGVRALAIGYVVGELVGFALYATVVGRSVDQIDRNEAKPSSLLVAARERVRPYLAFALPAGTVEMVSIVMITVTVMMLGWWHGPEAVADFRSVYPFGRLNQMVLLTFSVLFSPLATRYFARSDLAGGERAYWQTSTYLIVLSFPIFVLSVPLAWTTVPFVFGDQYASAAPVLAVLGTAYFFHSICGYNALVLQVHGRVRWVLVGNIASMSASLAVGALVIPSVGAVGVSWSVLTGLIVQNLINQVGLRRHLGFGWIDPMIARTVLLAAVLTAAVSGLAAADVPLAALFAAAAAASVVLLILTRRSLALADVFPSLAGLPVVGRMIS